VERLATSTAAPVQDIQGATSSPRPGPAFRLQQPPASSDEATRWAEPEPPDGGISNTPRHNGAADDEATPPLEASSSHGGPESPSADKAAEASNSSGSEDAPLETPATLPSDAAPPHGPLPDSGRGRKKPYGKLSHQTVWELQKQLRTGQSLRGKQLTPERVDELQRRLRFARAAAQFIAQPIVETVRAEASGVKQHMTDLAVGSVCLNPGTTPQDEYRANLLRIRQLQNRNSYLKEAAPKAKQQRKRAADEEAAAKDEAEGADKVSAEQGRAMLADGTAGSRSRGKRPRDRSHAATAIQT
jgi:hypothetical protein